MNTFKPIAILQNYCLDIIDLTTKTGYQLSRTEEYDKYLTMILPYIPLMFFDFANNIWSNVEPYIKTFMVRPSID
jgi:hypothetical protein